MLSEFYSLLCIQNEYGGNFAYIRPYVIGAVNKLASKNMVALRRVRGIWMQNMYKITILQNI